MRLPIKSVRELARALWNDSLFHYLLAAVALVSGCLLLVPDVVAEAAYGLILLGCLAAMLEVLHSGKD